MRKWRTEDTKDLYNINGWGNGYLDINDKGNAVIYPKGKITGAGIDLKEVVDEVLQNEISLPLLLRFPDILDNRLERISACFDKASKEYNYNAQYFTVYPIKVNQQRPVVEEIVRHGKKFNIGLEAGSKPELHAVLAVMDNPKALLICNGYKDQEFIELALLAQKMGKRIYLVVEKLNELKMIYKVSQALDVKPNIGIRIKLSSSGSGKWELSGGDQSKFGLNASELMDAVEYAKEKDMLSCIQLIHFHLGSQITNIRKIKSGLREVAQFYVQLMKMGCPLEFVDIGGGLGVDYDGSSTSVESSLNYTIQEYANDAIYTLADACEKNNLKHPNLISESGRALTAHHSMLVFNVLESTSLPSWNDTKHALPKNCHEKILELHEMYHNLTSRNMLEAYHDAIQLREDILDMFSLGIITLADRATCERLFWSITRKCSDMAVEIKNAPEELTSLGKRLADKYFCNFSLFQSLPDSWAIDQLFPIIPIHRLNEKPEVLVTLQDITCDSDGKIEKFIGVKDYTNGLLLHPFKKGSDYFIGVFLVGAYQEILGDLHNLFGDTNVAHVVTDGNDGYTIERILHGESVADVLEYVQFDSRSLVRTMESWVNASVKAGKISSEEGKVFLANYSSGLYGYTYLEE